MKDVVAKMLEEGLLGQQAADRVSALKVEGKSLDEALLAGSGLPEEQVLRYLAEDFQIPYVDIEHCLPAKEFLSNFPARILLKHRILPLEERDAVVLVATSKLSDTTGVDQL